MLRVDGPGSTARVRRRLAGVAVASAVFAAFALPGVVASAQRGSAPAFPEEVAPYAWWTSPLSGGDIGAAVMLYQNGYGVEFLDNPQAVLLASDGSTYRRHSTAESLAGAVDQGDPAESVLSPDGSTVVTAGLYSGGVVTVTSLRTGATTDVAVGNGLNAIPVSMDDSGSVLLLTSEAEMSPLLDLNFRLHGDLARLDLTSGEVEHYPGLTDVSGAALSPDGSRIAADTADGIVVADTDGSNRLDVPLSGGSVSLDGDAWSPDNRRLAVFGSEGLTLVDVTTEPVITTVPVGAGLFGSIVGWRDTETVLLHANDGSGSNTSAFSWVDVTSGTLDTFSTYTPDLTGAALGGVDVARNLLPSLDVRPLPVLRGWAPTVLALLVAVGAGLLAWRWLPVPVSLHRVASERGRRSAYDEARLELDPGR
jgi:hypothetical protein